MQLSKPLSCGHEPAPGAVDNANLLVDERNRAGLDASHARDRQWTSQGCILIYPQRPKVALGLLSI